MVCWRAFLVGEFINEIIIAIYQIAHLWYETMKKTSSNIIRMKSWWCDHLSDVCCQFGDLHELLRVALFHFIYLHLNWRLFGAQWGLGWAISHRLGRIWMNAAGSWQHCRIWCRCFEGRIGMVGGGGVGYRSWVYIPFGSHICYRGY